MGGIRTCDWWYRACWSSPSFIGGGGTKGGLLLGSAKALLPPLDPMDIDLDMELDPMERDLAPMDLDPVDMVREGSAGGCEEPLEEDE